MTSGLDAAATIPFKQRKENTMPESSLTLTDKERDYLGARRETAPSRHRHATVAADLGAFAAATAARQRRCLPRVLRQVLRRARLASVRRTLGRRRRAR